MSLNDALSFSETAGKYFNLLLQTESTLEKLAKSDLGAAVSSLQQSLNSNTEKVSLLRSARDYFNKAVHIETGVRLAIAYYGLGICHHFLGDFENAKAAMRNVLDNKNYVSFQAIAKFFFFSIEIEAIRYYRALKKDGERAALQATTIGKINLIQSHAKIYLEEYGS